MTQYGLLLSLFFTAPGEVFPMPSSDPQWAPGRDPGPCGGQGCSPSRVMRRRKVRSKKWRRQLRRVPAGTWQKWLARLDVNINY